MKSDPETNPYESPRAANTPSQPGKGLDLNFFLINFAASVAFVLLCFVAVAEAFAGSGSPYSFFGGVIFSGPAAVVALGEWLLYMRMREDLKRPLGAVCGAVAAFTAFGFVANVFEALTDKLSPDAPPDPPDMMWFWLIFGSISLAIITYNSFCCWHRIRDRHGPISRDSGGIM